MLFDDRNLESSDMKLRQTEQDVGLPAVPMTKSAI